MNRLRGLLAAAVAAASLLTGAASASALETPPPPPDDGLASPLLRAYHQNFFCRPADRDGSPYWQGRLDAGVEPSDVTWRMTHTSTFNTAGIERIYRAYLRRNPEAGGGPQYWIQRANSGEIPLERAAALIAGSPEAERALPTTFVEDAWYPAELGRAPRSETEQRYWVDRAAQVGRQQAFTELFSTTEAERKRVASHFGRTLGRSPTRGEYSYWGQKEQESDVNVPVLISGTPEYQRRVDTGDAVFYCIHRRD